MAREVKGFNELIHKLGGLAKKYEYNQRQKITIGFAMPYTVYVHENIEANHPVGQAKFLSIAMNRKRAFMQKAMALGLRQKGSTLESVLLSSGKEVLEYARTLTPKDTGALRVSGYVATDKTANQMFALARARGMTLRKRVMASRAKGKK